MKKIILMLAVLPILGFANEVPRHCIEISGTDVKAHLLPSTTEHSQRQFSFMIDTAECTRTGAETIKCFKSFRQAVESCGLPNVREFSKAYNLYAQMILKSNTDVKSYRQLILDSKY